MTPPRGAPALIALATLTVLTLAACSEGEPPQPAAPGLEAATTVEDSAGIRIVTTSVTPDTPHWRVPPEPELELGAVEGDAVYLFQRPEFAARLENGNVVVADFGSGQLRFFGPDGSHLRSVGGKGQGPGEFREFNGVVRTPGDTLVVYDVRNRRVTRIGPSGARVDDASLNAPISARWQAGVRPFERMDTRVVGSEGERQLQRWRYAHAAAPTGEGRHLVPFYHPPEAAPTERDTVRGRIELVAVEPGGGTGEVVASLDGPLTLPFWLDGRDRGQGWIPIFRHVPFAGEILLAAGPGRVVLGRGDLAELAVVDATGLRLVIRRRAHTPAPVDGPLREQFVSWRIGRPGSWVEEAERGEAADAFEILGDDQRLPAHAEVFLDDDGRIWVRDWQLPWEEGEPATFTVFGEDGAVVATATLPGDLSVTHIGPDHVTGVVWDELGIEYVRVYRIVRDEGFR